MLTNLDLLVIVCLALAAVSLMAVALMFLVRTPRIKTACFRLVCVLGVGVCAASLGMFWPEFFGQAALALVLGVVSAAALVMGTVGKEKRLCVARVLAALALILGSVNFLL